MGSPLVEHVASLLSATVSRRARRRCSPRCRTCRAGVFWIVGAVVLVIVGLRAGRACATSPTTGSGSSRSSGRCKGSVPEGRIIALDGEAGFQAEVLRGGLHFGLLAVAVPDPQAAAGHGAARQDRLCLRPRRRGAAAEPDAGPGDRLQQLPGRPRLPGRRVERAPTRSRSSASEAGSGRSCAKASTRSTSRSSR